MMKKLFNYTDEAQALIKEKMEAGQVEMDYKIVWGFLNAIEEKIEDVELSQGWALQVLSLGRSEYLILTDEEAEEAARESVEDLIIECGVQCLNLELSYYYKENFLKNLARENLEWWIHGASEEEILEEMDQLGAKDVEELIVKTINYYGAEEYLLNFFEEEKLLEIAIENDGLNYEKIIDDVIWMDGRGGCLASYDHQEIAFPVGEDETYYAYRIS